MKKQHHLHLVSDSTGGTLNSVVKACVAQFDGVGVEEHFWPLIRSEKQLQNVCAQIQKNPGPVFYTMVDDGMARLLEKHCRSLNVPVLSMLQPVLALMSDYFHMTSLSKPGLQHKLNDDYFARMDAVDYALYHDDGQKSDHHLGSSDVLLVGVSRTSKTPTCLYLANRGVKAANIPYVPNIPFPDHVLSLKNPLFIGLTASPARLVEIRRNRLQQLGEWQETDYLNLEKVKEEVREARQFYNKQNWPVIDVTRRSIEETAAEILALLDRVNENKQTAIKGVV